MGEISEYHFQLEPLNHRRRRVTGCTFFLKKVDDFLVVVLAPLHRLKLLN